MPYSVNEMPGFEPNTVVHYLNIRAKCQPIKQGKRSFAPERQEAIKDEVQKLS